MAGKREEQLKEITERLEQGVQELFTSEKYTEYLKTMSQFHNYSFNNTLLIAMQKPESTLVAGYGTWSKKFHRQVKRGEKGIKIIAPAPIREKEEIEKFDPETNEPVLRPDGQPETEEVEHIIPRFRVATVFDISQTYGDPLPELDTPELMGSVENFEIFMEAIRMVSPAPMRYAEIEGDSKGYYSNTNKEIVIREGMSEKQTMKTAVHEVTHAMCHDRDVMEELGEKKNRMTKEVEAESVAFTVCSFFNLDTSDYSFPYIAGWSSDMDMKELRTSMDFIRKTAGSFIDSMVENIQKLQREQPDKEHLEENDLVLKVVFPLTDMYTYLVVENIDKQELLAQLNSYHELYAQSDEMTVQTFLEGQGIIPVPWYDFASLMVEHPVDFFDIEYTYEAGIVDASELPAREQAELLMNRAEYGKTIFNDQDRNLIINYAYKFDDIEDAKALIQELVEAMESPSMWTAQEIKDNAQAEIDSLPDSMIGLTEMHEFGYHNDSVLPLTMGRAVELHHAGLHIYSLQEDGSSVLMNTEQDILETGGMFGVDAKAWESYKVMESVREEKERKEEIPEDSQGQEHVNENIFFNDNQDRFAIYQIKDDSKGREYLFMGMDFLKRQGLAVEYADYEMVYTDVLMEKDTLDSLYEKFNIGRPDDFKGHSLSVSDVVALKRGGEITAHYVDSFGYTELPEFLHQREESILQEPETADMGEEYQEVEIFEVPALFSNGRIAENEVPAELYRYDLRGSDYDTGDPVTLENHVTVNHAGTILSAYPLPIPERGYLRLGEELNFIGGMATIEQFRQSAATLNTKVMEERLQNAVIHSNEELLYTDTADRYAIFQINEDTKGRDYILADRDEIEKYGFEIDGEDYSLIYGGRLTLTGNVETICEKINTALPEGYTGHYPASGDVVVINRRGKVTAHYLDIYGSMELPDFIKQREQVLDAEARRQIPEEEMYPPLYTHTLSYAMEHGKADDYLESRKLNLDCKKAVEDAIRENFDGMHLAHDAAESVLEEYGAERVTFILANTVQQLEYDGRFSIDNKEWAKGFEIPENVSRGIDVNADYIISSHPAVLDGFIGLARAEIREQELRQEMGIQIDEETRGFTADGHFGTWHTAGVQEIKGELFYLMEHDEYGDSVASIIVNQEGKLVAEDLEHGFDQGAMDAISEYFAEKGMTNDQEVPFIAQYYVIQNVQGEKAEREYQYFADIDTALEVYHQIPNHMDKQIGMESVEQPPTRMSLIECRNGIETLTDIEFDSLSGKWVREETMEAAQQAKKYLDNHDIEVAYQTGKGYFSIQTVSDGYDYTIYDKNFREVDGGVYDDPDITVGEAMEAILSDEGISTTSCKVMDYEELQERVETVAQEDLQKAQEEIREKLPLISEQTEPEPALNGQSRAEIEETVLCYAQAQIDEMGLTEEVELLGARVYGSRSREGLYHEGSDIDVVVSYSGDLKEDAFFNVLHEDGLKIAGIPVDINPISMEKTGTLEEYLENANQYLDMKEVKELAGDIASFADSYSQFKLFENNMGKAEYHHIYQQLAEGRVESYVSTFDKIVNWEDNTDLATFQQAMKIQGKLWRLAGLPEAESMTEKTEAKISFYVAECMEFPVLGEFHENLETLEEAMKLYEKIPSERMNGIKGIGFCLEDGSMYDGNFDLMVAGKVETEFINEIPHYKESSLVQKAIVDMERILSKQAERDMPGPGKEPEPLQQPISQGLNEKDVHTQEVGKIDTEVHETSAGDARTEAKAPEPEKSSENAPKTDQHISGGSKKQSVLNALRERQARMKAQEKEKQGERSQARKKGGQEL